MKDSNCILKAEPRGFPGWFWGINGRIKDTFKDFSMKNWKDEGRRAGGLSLKRQYGKNKLGMYSLEGVFKPSLPKKPPKKLIKNPDSWTSFLEILFPVDLG